MEYTVLNFDYNQPTDVWFGGENFVKVFTCSLSASRLILVHTKIINDDQDDYAKEEEDILIHPVVS